MTSSKVDSKPPEKENTNLLPSSWAEYLKMLCVDAFARVTTMMLFRKVGTVNRNLSHFLLPRVAASSKPVNGIYTEDVLIDSVNSVSARIFTPKGTSSDQKIPVILYYHGGGFVTCSALNKDYDAFCRKIAEWCNAVVVSTDYRLAPECPFPAAYDDCYNAINWLQSPESKSRLPAAADVSQCFLMGDSAGGNIVHFVGSKAVQNDISPVKLGGMIELQPFYGGEEVTRSETEMRQYILTTWFCRWACRAFWPGQSRDNPYFNVFGPNAFDISELSLPPIMVVVGLLDILKDWQTGYIKNLKGMGKDVEAKYYSGYAHGSYFMGTEDQSKKYLADVRDFIRSHTL